MFRAIVCFGLITLAFASATLDVLVNSAASFLGYDPGPTRNAPKRSGAGRARRKDD